MSDNYPREFAPPVLHPGEIALARVLLARHERAVTYHAGRGLRALTRLNGPLTGYHGRYVRIARAQLHSTEEHLRRAMRVRSN